MPIITLPMAQIKFLQIIHFVGTQPFGMQQAT